jgi:hypothetical protein
MSDTNLDDAIEHCTHCDDAVLSVYLEDGLCPNCQ